MHITYFHPGICMFKAQGLVREAWCIYHIKTFWPHSWCHVNWQCNICCNIHVHVGLQYITHTRVLAHSHTHRIRTSGKEKLQATMKAVGLESRLERMNRVCLPDALGHSFGIRLITATLKTNVWQWQFSPGMQNKYRMKATLVTSSKVKSSTQNVKLNWLHYTVFCVKF